MGEAVPALDFCLTLQQLSLVLCLSNGSACACVCSQRRCSVLQWNPDVATQLVVASDDDRSPTLQMWDLRNSMSPVKEFVGHTKVGAVASCAAPVWSS